ncbi:MAG: PAS domain S-box protein [Proteobacteria bacterium]|nr:PAS domain S-box protein [Pseudomonadota bacterium]
MDFSPPQLAALAAIACAVVALAFMAAMRSQYRLAEAERRRASAAEARLREEQRLSRSMMDNTSDLMAIYRIDGDRLMIAEWNRALRRFYAELAPAVDLEGWMGRSIEDFLREVNGMDPDAVAQRLAPFRRAAASKLPVNYVTSIPGAHGPQRRESLIVPLTDAEGRVTHLFYRAVDVTARHASEDELLRSAERFTRMFAVSPVATAIADLEDGRYLDVNAAWCALTGYSREEAIGRTAQDIGFWADDHARRAGFAPVLERGETVQLEHRFTSKQGKALRLLMSAGPIELDGRRCALAIIQDVTKLEEARALATRLTGQFAGMFNLVPNALAIVHLRDARLLAVNDAWSRLYGWLRAEALGRTALDLGLWADPADREKFMVAIAREGRLRPAINRLRARDGHEVLCLSSAEIIDWQDEQAILVSHQDITELESLRRETQTLGERFAKVFDLSPTPIVVGAIEDGHYLAVNEAWLQLHGYSREELAGRGSLSLGVWADPADRARIVDMISRGIEVRRMPVRFRKKSGEIFETLYSATLADWEGTRAIIATPQDVTEINRASREIRRLNETLEERVGQRTAELEQSNRELESFSYSVSHDLRAPLRAMSAFSALLAARPAVAADSEAAGYARRINAAASRMGTMVDALLQFSRLSRQEVALRPVPLAAEVEAITAELAQAAAGRRLRWVVGPLPTVRGDPALLRLVLQNLLENAVKYTARCAEAVIEVDATQAGGETVVRVRDNGVGFDMRYADKLFGVFERLHADGEFEGTGIGLANARRIVQRHGGRIWCTAAPGQGAAFYFALPD